MVTDAFLHEELEEVYIEIPPRFFLTSGHLRKGLQAKQALYGAQKVF